MSFPTFKSTVEEILVELFKTGMSEGGVVSKLVSKERLHDSFPLFWPFSCMLQHVGQCGTIKKKNTKKKKKKTQEHWI